jgi:hypothetical protein
VVAKIGAATSSVAMRIACRMAFLLQEVFPRGVG